MVKEIPVPIAVNNRHVHLSEKDAHALFGESHDFSQDLSRDRFLWPGHTVLREKVTISGPAGSIPNVGLLGPLGKKTSIEMSTADAYRLGLDTGEIRSKKFGPGVTVTGPKGKVFVEIDQPVNGRWLLVSKKNAEKNGLKDGMSVDVRVGSDSDWTTTFHNFRVIVSDEGDRDHWAVYLDADAASAASARAGDTAHVLLH